MSAAFTSLTSSSSSSTPPPAAASATTPAKPSLKSYYQLVVDAQGETSVLQREYKDVQEVGYSNTPQLLTKVPTHFATPTAILFTALAGANPWHHCPTPQIVVCLRGGWYVQTTDGETTELLAGDVIYQDNTVNHPGAAAGKGGTTEHAAMHYSGSLTIDGKDKPCDQMIVQLQLKEELVANSKDAEAPF
jgi:hypothetical protein